MTQIATSIQIARPRDEVFAFVTTPGNWPKWHPSSLGVRGATDHSLAVGERDYRGLSCGGTERASRLDSHRIRFSKIVDDQWEHQRSRGRFSSLHTLA